MKKLMVIAAAMTIACGVYAAGCTPDELDCSMVYKVKMSLKAGRPKTQKGKCDTVCYRTPTKVTVEGYAVLCDYCDCEAFQEGLSWTLWSKKEKAMYMDGEGVEWDFLNVIGKKADEVEGAFTIDTYAFTGYAAGFGKLDKKYCTPKSMSGEIAGFGGVPGCSTGDACNPSSDNCTWAYACADYCAGDYDTAEGIDSELPTAYTGKWSLKYSSSDSKKYTASKWNPKIPDFSDFGACADWGGDSGGTGDGGGTGE